MIFRLFSIYICVAKSTLLHRVVLDGEAKCMDGTQAVAYVDRDTDIPSADGFYIFLQGGGECWNIPTCNNRCPEGTAHPEYCTAMTEQVLEKSGNLWGDDPAKNPFAKFVKVYLPFCSSDIHQGDSGPDATTGDFMFRGRVVMRELVNYLSKWHQLGTAKRVILNGSSSGGKGTAGTCNMVGDMLAELSNDIDFRCIADAAGWIPLPVYNTPDCDNDRRELSSTALWGRKVDPECSRVANAANLNNVTECSFETQYAQFLRYPVMFTGSFQDTIFLERHLCKRPWTTADSDVIGWWIQSLHDLTIEFTIARPDIGFWITSCPGHGQIYGQGYGGWNPNVVRGVTIVDAMRMWALEDTQVHAIDSAAHSNPFCPDGFCNAIGRRSNCGQTGITEEQCASYGCAWCPDGNQHQCIHIVLN